MPGYATDLYTVAGMKRDGPCVGGDTEEVDYQEDQSDMC
jgi:hypothetical protein